MATQQAQNSETREREYMKKLKTWIMLVVGIAAGTAGLWASVNYCCYKNADDDPDGERIICWKAGICVYLSQAGCVNMHHLRARVNAYGPTVRAITNSSAGKRTFKLSDTDNCVAWVDAYFNGCDDFVGSCSGWGAKALRIDGSSCNGPSSGNCVNPQGPGFPLP